MFNKLTHIDISLLSIFMQNEGRTISKNYLSEKALGIEVSDGSGITKHIRDLQKKLNGSGSKIREVCTVYDKDYHEIEYIFERKC